jgi:hypothetical protein
MFWRSAIGEDRGRSCTFQSKLDAREVFPAALFSRAILLWALRVKGFDHHGMTYRLELERLKEPD